LEQAVEQGAKTLIIGVANRGGRISPAWQQTMVRALELGMDIASGLHNKVADIPIVREAAQRLGRNLFDVRHPDRDFDLGTGAKRPGLRLLTVGTDCSIGKMFTALALEKEMRARGMNADFRATGQTGILIAGSGVSIDAVVADFISGAVEYLSPANAPDHWDVVEGQATVLHPSYAGVTVGLVMGSQPDAMVVCHEPTRPHMRGLPHRPVPSIRETMLAHEVCAHVTNPEARVIGIAVNTSGMGAPEAMAYLRSLEDEFALPAEDPVRTGTGRIIDRLQELYPTPAMAAAS
jgi:uncharacterized NAD-dependent epimerase/dehydratase family protein